MIAFWIAAVVGIIVTAIYITLAVQAFARVRRDILTAQTDGDTADRPVVELGSEEHGVFTWKAGLAVVASTTVIVLLGINPVFWYLPPILAVGTGVAVIVAFVIDRRSAA